MRQLSDIQIEFMDGVEGRLKFQTCSVTGILVLLMPVPVTVTIAVYIRHRIRRDQHFHPNPPCLTGKDVE